MREATIHIPESEYERLGIGPFVERCLDAGLRNLTELACRGTGCLLVVTLDSELPAGALDDVDGISWWEQLSAGDDPVYLCKVTPGARANPAAPVHELAVSNSDITVEDAGLDVSIVGTQTSLARSVEAYREAGVDVLLKRMADYGGPRSALDGVTDRQREILETAYDRGYFDVPRRASADEVAAELSLDPSTVTEHLRRAERNLLSELLG